MALWFQLSTLIQLRTSEARLYSAACVYILCMEDLLGGKWHTNILILLKSSVILAFLLPNFNFLTQIFQMHVPDCFYFFF